MDLRQIMILCKGRDKTAEIASCRLAATGGKYEVVYAGGAAYDYNKENVAVLYPQESVTGKGVFCHKGAPVPGLKEAVLFTDGRLRHIRAFLADGTTVCGPAEDFAWLEDAAATPKGRTILGYWRSLARQIPPDKDDDGRSFLDKAFDGLDFVHPQSALARYLEGRLPAARPPHAGPHLYPFRFNLSQKAALETALTHGITVIEGPPGTGKTQTILNILANLVAVEGKSVGVVSFNNEAVKNVKDKLGKQEYGFLAADLGRREKRRNFFAALPEAKVDGWDCGEEAMLLRKRLAGINAALDDLLKKRNRLAELKEELAAYRLERRHFERFYAEQRLDAIEKLPFYAASSDRIAEYLADAAVADKLHLRDTLLYKLRQLIKYRRFRFGKFGRDDADTLLHAQKAFYALKLRELDAKRAKLDAELKGASFEGLTDEHQRLSERLFRHCLHRAYRNMPGPDFTEQDYKRRFGAFRKYYPIVLSTNHSLRNSLPQGCLLDYVIIDEASQVDLLTGALALSCCRNVIVVGDLKQLPHIADKRIHARQKPSDVPPEYDYFSHSLLSSLLALYEEKLPRVMLREHYRCHPDIIGFCNRKFYDGALIPFTDPEMSRAPLRLYRTSEGNHMRVVTRGKDEDRGWYNRRELDVVEREVLEALNLPRDPDKVGFATPYRKQARQAAACFGERAESDTVHKYQGREKDVIIMSTVLDASRQGKLGTAFVDDPRLINVAVSRAVRQFILVTDHDAFLNKGRHVRDLMRYIRYHAPDEHVVESRVASIFDLLYKKYAERLRALQATPRYRSRFPSENRVCLLLERLLGEARYAEYDFRPQVYLRNLLRDARQLDDEAARYVRNGASVDFVVFTRLDKRCILVIEVNGFAFHENNPDQLRRDGLKKAILDACTIPFLPLPTNGSGEEEKIRAALDAASCAG